MRTTCVVAIAMMAALLTASAYGAIMGTNGLYGYFEDDFESYPDGTYLTGLKSPAPFGLYYEGPVWGSGAGGRARAAWSVDGSNGYEGTQVGNKVLFNTPSNPVDPQKPLIMEWDVITHGLQDYYPQVWITEQWVGTGKPTFSFNFESKGTFHNESVAIGLKTGSSFDPPDYNYNGAIQYGIAPPQRAMHQKYQFDIAKKKLNFTIWDVDNPDVKKSWNFTWTEDWTLNRFNIYSLRSNSGIDNLRIYIPEPASMALLGMGGLLLRWRRRSA